MTVLEVIQRSTEFLARKGVESPRLQVELLLAHVLQRPRLQLYLNFERALTAAELDAVRAMVQRRGGREPLQHITGSTSFCGLEITVNGHALVPRPETELLAERAWNFLKSRPAPGAAARRALDFGTGSGCIAIALAVHAPATTVTAVEISEAALAVARGNAARHQVHQRIEFIRAASLSALAAGATFDLIVSNPPYIPSAAIASLDAEVREFDPREALDGGADGLDLYRQLASETTGRLRSGGQIMLEFGDGQARAVAQIFSQAGWVVEAVEQDLSGRERILIVSGH